MVAKPARRSGKGGSSVLFEAELPASTCIILNTVITAPAGRDSGGGRSGAGYVAGGLDA